MGSTFAGARQTDEVSYQILFFFLGPTGLGKSELKRIIKILFGTGMWMQPDLNVWGQKFSSGTLAFLSLSSSLSLSLHAYEKKQVN